MMENNKNIMIGFPSSGKTTFIAALWKYLKDNNDKNFKLDQLPIDREYLEQLVESWIQCEPLSRTFSGTIEEITFTVNSQECQGLNIFIPDIKGEAYKQIFLTREIEKELFLNLKEANGLLIFINSQLDDVSTHNRFGGETSNNDNVNPSKIQPFSSEDTPIRIQLVDVLQSILDINNKALKVAVVISAWDLIEDNITPLDWARINVPFVFHFLQNNFVNIKYFGISAQGGDYKSKKEELLSMSLPIDRIKVYEDNNCSNDITLPLQHLNT